MPGIDRSLPLRARPVIEPKPTPLRTRLAAAHGDADQAALLLDEAARSFHMELERLMMIAAEPTGNPPAADRPRLRFGSAARNTRRSPALPVVVVTPAG